MDQAREPGIRFAGVVVERLRFDDVEPGSSRPDQLAYGVALERRQFDDPRAVEVVVHFEIRSSTPERSRFHLEVSVSGRFLPDESSQNMDLERFAAVNGPALVMPFVREVVANMTARSRHGTVILPPINVQALLAGERATSER